MHALILAAKWPNHSCRPSNDWVRGLAYARHLSASQAQRFVRTVAEKPTASSPHPMRAGALDGLQQETGSGKRAPVATISLSSWGERTTRPRPGIAESRSRLDGQPGQKKKRKKRQKTKKQEQQKRARTGMTLPSSDFTVQRHSVVGLLHSAGVEGCLLSMSPNDSGASRKRCLAPESHQHAATGPVRA